MDDGNAAVVFGGAGFIGTHLIRFLKTTGRYSEIIIADIRGNDLASEDGVKRVYCDVRAPIQIETAGRVVDIFNLAAVHTTPGYEDWEYFWTNIRGALEVCKFAETTNARTIVFTSSISTYGPTEETRDETGPFQPESAYGRSKFLAEGIHRNWQAAAPARRLVVVRPAVIFGAGEGGNFTRLAAMLKKGLFFYPGRKDTVKSCGYVKELVRSIAFAMAQNQPELTYNFAYPQRYTSEQICEAFHAAAGYARPSFVMPLGLMLAAGRMFEILAAAGLRTSINRARVMKLVNSTNIVPRRLLALGYVFERELKDDIADWHRDVNGGDFV